MYATFPTTQKIKTWEEFTTPQLVVIVLLDDKSRQLGNSRSIKTSKHLCIHMSCVYTYYVVQYTYMNGMILLLGRMKWRRRFVLNFD